MKEKDLILKAKQNDQKAFNILFNKNWEYLYNFQLELLLGLLISSNPLIQNINLKHG